MGISLRRTHAHVQPHAHTRECPCVRARTLSLCVSARTWSARSLAAFPSRSWACMVPSISALPVNLVRRAQLHCWTASSQRCIWAAMMECLGTATNDNYYTWQTLEPEQTLEPDQRAFPATIFRDDSPDDAGKCTDAPRPHLSCRIQWVLVERRCTLPAFSSVLWLGCPPAQMTGFLLFVIVHFLSGSE